MQYRITWDCPSCRKFHEEQDLTKGQVARHVNHLLVLNIRSFLIQEMGVAKKNDLDVAGDRLNEIFAKGHA